MEVLALMAAEAEDAVAGGETGNLLRECSRTERQHCSAQVKLLLSKKPSDLKACITFAQPNATILTKKRVTRQNRKEFSMIFVLNR